MPLGDSDRSGRLGITIKQFVCFQWWIQQRQRTCQFNGHLRQDFGRTNWQRQTAHCVFIDSKIQFGHQVPRVCEYQWRHHCVDWWRAPQPRRWKPHQNDPSFAKCFVCGFHRYAFAQRRKNGEQIWQNCARLHHATCGRRPNGDAFVIRGAHSWLRSERTGDRQLVCTHYRRFVWRTKNRFETQVCQKRPSLQRRRSHSFDCLGHCRPFCQKHWWGFKRSIGVRQ